MSHGADVNLAVERRLQGGVDPAFRDTLEIGLTQRHVDDIETVVAGHALDLAGKTEPGQHTAGVVVSTPADVGDHPGDRCGSKRLGAQAHCGPFDGFGVVPGDQQLHVATGNRQQLGTGCLGESKERGHALV